MLGFGWTPGLEHESTKKEMKNRRIIKMSKLDVLAWHGKVSRSGRSKNFNNSIWSVFFGSYIVDMLNGERKICKGN